ncbi:hypothetical protein [Metabacillus iocasae]|uniref:Uncharacterized protein n=1 Tax=Priestia iocasae TaxID=2291674 RepID=A0ABS2QRG4_9BACI|nr:hypothetical protein [Metabacillus iocasae]MBM7702041.1 hypothetical protein [Metabacillus iocasae]
MSIHLLISAMLLSSPTTIHTEKPMQISQLSIEDKKTIILNKWLAAEANRPLKKSFIINKDSKNALLKTSANQQYTLYVFNEYEFAEEEPGKDMIFSKENPHEWMRIEVLRDDTNLDDAASDMKTFFEAGFGHSTEGTPPSSPEALIKDIVKVYETENEKEVGKAYLIKGNDSRPPLRVTIVAPKELNKIPLLLKMIETIEKK